MRLIRNRMERKRALRWSYHKESLDEEMKKKGRIEIIKKK
jgi:hypothetical protein